MQQQIRRSWRKGLLYFVHKLIKKSLLADKRKFPLQVACELESLARRIRAKADSMPSAKETHRPHKRPKALKEGVVSEYLTENPKATLKEIVGATGVSLSSAYKWRKALKEKTWDVSTGQSVSDQPS